MEQKVRISRDELEDRLEYKFDRGELLERALTHSSAGSDSRPSGGVELAEPELPCDNERLEFLGDAVLELVTSEFLLGAFPQWSEGQLSKSRAQIVNARSLEAAARRLKLGEYLILSKGEEKTGGREKQTILADAFEALVAAVYLDSGLPAARDFLQRSLLESAMGGLGERLADSDCKSALQEFLQARGKIPAEYRLAGERGPDHKKTFLVEVWIEGRSIASGEGASKKEAEQQAASNALSLLEQKFAKG
jgi:ribonuclease III